MFIKMKLYLHFNWKGVKMKRNYRVFRRAAVCLLAVLLVLCTACQETVEKPTNTVSPTVTGTEGTAPTDTLPPGKEDYRLLEIGESFDIEKNILQEDLSQYGVDMATLELTQQDSDAGYGLKVVLNEEPARWCQGLIFHM